jgi:hypothetical protein
MFNLNNETFNIENLNIKQTKTPSSSDTHRLKIKFYNSLLTLNDNAIISYLKELSKTSPYKLQIGFDADNTLIKYNTKNTLNLLLELIMFELKQTCLFKMEHLNTIEIHIKMKIDKGLGNNLKCGYILENGEVMNYENFISMFIDPTTKTEQGLSCFDIFTILLPDILNSLVKIYDDRSKYSEMLKKITWNLYNDEMLFYNEVCRQPEKYLQAQYSFNELKELSNGPRSSLHLITNGTENWIKFAMEFCYGLYWENLFETKIYSANKPHYFSTIPYTKLDIYIGDSLNSDLLPTLHLKTSVFLLSNNPWLYGWYWHGKQKFDKNVVQF